MAVMADWGTAAYSGRNAYPRTQETLYEQQYYASEQSSSSQSYDQGGYTTQSSGYDAYPHSIASGSNGSHHYDDYSAYKPHSVQSSGSHSSRVGYQDGYKNGYNTSYEGEQRDDAYHSNPSSSTGAQNQNMAGFGARKLMEKNRQRVEQAQEYEQRQRQRQYEKEQQRLREEQAAWEEEQRAYYESQARQQQQQQQQQRSAYHEDARHPQPFHHHGGADAQKSTSSRQHERRSRAAQEWYEQEEWHQRQEAGNYSHADYGASPSAPEPVLQERIPGTDSAEANGVAATSRKPAVTAKPVSRHIRTDTGQSSLDGLAYDRAEAEPPSGEGEFAVFTGSAAANKSPALSLLRQGNNVRETIYEDDFEEGDEELAVNLARYTQYEGATDADEEKVATPWSGARKSLFRATTYEPLPKARCADCGESFNFEELAEHACEQASLPGTPTLSLTPLQPLHSLPEEHSLKASRSGSPFLDRYEEIHGKKSPARSPLLGHLGGPTRSASTDDRSRSRERGRMGLGLNIGDEMTRSQTSPMGSPLSEMAKKQQKSSSNDSALTLQSTTTSSELRKRIEAQREAKLKNAFAASLSDSPTNAFKQIELEKSGATEKSRAAAAFSRAQLAAPHRNLSNSSNSSAGTQASSLLAPGSSAVSLAITPSSTLDCFSDYAKGSSPPRKDLLSPKSAQEAWDRMNATEKSASVKESRKQRGTPTPTGTGSGQRSPLTPSLKSLSSPRPGRSPRNKDIDLGGIENLLKDLETSDIAPISSRSGSGTLNTTATRRPPPSPLKLASSQKKSPSGTRKPQRPTKFCCVCLCPLSSSKTRVVEKDGKYFCADDYKQLYLPKCTKCRQPVEKDAVKSRDGALKGVFHRSCFCCFKCDTRFDDGIFYVFENAPYCFEHYSALAGTQCASCNLGIEGTCRQTENGERYHPHCLTCQFENVKTGEFCQDILDDFYTIAGRRLCEHHAITVQKMLDKSGRKKAKAEKRRTMLTKLV
ncbi:unnamed protein product [Sympodiomycopsis kandeliae]